MEQRTRQLLVQVMRLPQDEQREFLKDLSRFMQNTNRPKALQDAYTTMTGPRGGGGLRCDCCGQRI